MPPTPPRSRNWFLPCCLHSRQSRKRFAPPNRDHSGFVGVHTTYNKEDQKEQNYISHRLDLSSWLFSLSNCLGFRWTTLRVVSVSLPLLYSVVSTGPRNPLICLDGSRFEGTLQLGQRRRRSGLLRALVKTNWLNRFRWDMLKPPQNHQDQHDDQNGSKSSRRTISPRSAVWPSWNRTKEQQNQNNKQNCSEHCRFSMKASSLFSYSNGMQFPGQDGFESQNDQSGRFVIAHRP
jgi:hypothetical protein